MIRYVLLLIAMWFGFLSTAEGAGDVAAGKAKAATCAACHSANGRASSRIPRWQARARISFFRR
jgi:cytochrome c553